MFADPESKLSKYGPKSWRSSHTHGLDANGRPLLELHFRVQFYIESPCMLKDETTRHNYYLQLRHNVLQRELPRDYAEQSLVLLAAMALQADLGDAPSTAGAAGTSSKCKQPKQSVTTTLPKIRKRLSSYNERMYRLSNYVSSSISNAPRDSEADYFKLEDYLPAALQTARAKSALQACHRNHQGLNVADAELLYIQQACALHETINAHTYRMRLAKSEAGVGSAWFVVYAKGIKILSAGAAAAASEPATFLWPNITKLSFERKKFEIRCGESRITLYASTDEKNKLLLTLCKDTHQWSMKLAARCKELQHKREQEEAETQSLHASYACSRSLHLPYKSKNEQRISVISSTSSNTTSGIVSDRVHSEDELEIMINTPPAPLAAPSTESLALAHLLDRPSVSRQTSSVGALSLKELEQQLATVATAAAPEPPASNDSPSSAHNIGSQCSSTCSTVVVSTAAPLAVAHSSCSSLELGFSHTAQNSALSETVHDETESVSGVSGVYTLTHGLAPPTETSGVYTMHSSELTEQCSERADSEQSCKASAASNSKTLSDFRLRSDSNISTSSSFRGDGSDPTDKQQALLSADELTKLIVGRGTYPSCQAVASNMLSDCDYVSQATAPPPYSARHEKTGLCGPPIQPEKQAAATVAVVPAAVPTPPPAAAAPAPPVAPLRRRDPPPYASSSKPRPTSLITLPAAPSSCLSSPKAEELQARFITTRSHINILKAHTSLLPDGAKPSYAAPTTHSSAASSSASICSHQLSQQSLHNSNYASSSALLQHLPHHRHSGSAAIGIPIVPYGLHHKSSASLHHQPHRHHAQQRHHAHHLQQQEPAPCVLVPLIKPRQFLPPPPPSLPRQPPPPPPPNAHAHLTSLYGAQLTRTPLELYQQQLYSDVDYVFYPLQDPAVSQQEYLDAKQSSLLAAMAAQSPAPYVAAYPAGWDTCKGHAIYRSTPYLPLACSRYASTQNLSDTYVQLPAGAGYSPLYSPSMASLCSSYEPPPPPPPLHPAAAALAASNLFARSRSRSDDNILNSLDSLPLPKMKRLPPPPPPPYVNRLKKPPMPAPSEQPPPIPCKPSASCMPSQLHMLPPRKPPTLNPHSANSPLTKTSSGAQWAGERPKPDLGLGYNRNNNSNSILAQLQASMAASQAAAQANPLDIALLREKSKHLDLPLISALCNDHSLLKQTKLMTTTATATTTTAAAATTTTANTTTLTTTTTATATVNGTGTLNKTRSKLAAISHRHPQDKLPPLPVQLAEANNYVMDPAMKHHKAYNSQSQTQSQSQSQT
ncbi:protein expanded isoform X2 [Drosophila busckii]|nr:protein expanded isoform X2 [Drosophila busckii]